MHENLPGTPPLVRAVNRRRILDHVRRIGEVSRAELAKVTAIRPPTVSAVVRQLVAEGLVEEVGNGSPDTGTGRPPRMVSLSRNRPCAIGFEISASAVRAGVCDLGGKLQREIRVDVGPESPERTVCRLSRMARDLLHGLGLTWADMRGVGIALPGLVDAVRGFVRWSRPLGWSHVPLGSLCETQWSVPTDVVNNAVAGSMAAQFLGVAQEVRDLLYFFVRFNVVEPGFTDPSNPIVRVGCGIIINGEPYHGHFGAAGEVSLPITHPLVHARDEDGRRFPDTDALAAAFETGQPSAVAAIDQVAREMGLVLELAVSVVDPGALVLDSDVPVLRDALLLRLRTTLTEDRLRQEVGIPQLVPSTLGEFGMVHGAMVPTLQRVFRMPRWI